MFRPVYESMKSLVVSVAELADGSIITIMLPALDACASIATWLWTSYAGTVWWLACLWLASMLWIWSTALQVASSFVTLVLAQTFVGATPAAAVAVVVPTAKSVALLRGSNVASSTSTAANNSNTINKENTAVTSPNSPKPDKSKDKDKDKDKDKEGWVGRTGLQPRI